MISIARLAILEWWTGKSWFLALVALTGAAFVAPLVTASSIDPDILGPARAQWIYGAAFLLAILYCPVVAAELGAKQVQRNHRLFWRAQGVGNVEYFAGLVFAGLAPAILVSVAATIGIVFFGISEQSAVVKAQAMALTFLATFSVIPFTIGLAQLVSGTVAFFFAISIELAGVYAPPAIEFIRQREGASQDVRMACEVFLTLVPRLGLGDQSERLTFGWPLIPWEWFGSAVAYFLFVFLVSSALGYVLFRARRI